MRYRNKTAFPAARAALVTASVVLGLAACGDSGFVPTSVQHDDSAATEPATVSATADYASVAVIPLASVGLPESTQASQVTVQTGDAPGLTVRDGQIRFIAPSDPGVDGSVRLRVAVPGSDDVTIAVTLRSVRPTRPATVIEPNEAGEPGPNAIKSELIVTGLGPNNALTGDALSFSVAGAPAFDPKASGASIAVPQLEKTFDLAKYWTLDATTNTLTISAQDMATVLQMLPSGEFDVDVGLSDSKSEFAVAWTFRAYKPAAMLQGKVVDADGSPQLAAAGRQVAIRGFDNGTRVVTSVDDQGAFTAGPLVAGTYEAVLLDAQAPGYWSVTVPVYEDSTQVDTKLTFVPSDTPSSRDRREEASSHAAGQRPTVRLLSPTSQDGKGPPARSGSAIGREGAQAATPAQCETTGETAGASTYTAMADQRDVTVGCQVEHTVAQGISHVGVKLIVSSEEHPYYTQSKSPYNDTWSYAVGLQGIMPASGFVNDTHYTSGTLTKEYCVSVAGHTQAGAYTFTASLAATNVGDSLLPTMVTLEVTPSCGGSFKVSRAAFGSPNEAGYGVIRHGGSADLPGHYVSLPIVTAAEDWGLPLEVEYEPKEAEVTQVRLGAVIDGQAVMSDVDHSASISSRSPGRLTWANVVIPRIAGVPFPGKTSLLVELMGTIDGQPVSTQAMDSRIQFDGTTAFTPLFLAGDELGSASRYGQAAQPEAGFDSWATFNTIAWLKDTGYRFNDISALHVARTAKGRSVLDHAGHGDGAQVDLRYADGNGGFDDALGGAEDGKHIKAMLDAAALETAEGIGTKGTALGQAVAWISANRSMLETEAANARRVYAGNTWMALALRDGAFPDGTAIPGITRWDTRPANLQFAEHHLHHWHISRW